MIDLLADASSQPVSSWRTWDAATWLFVIGGVVSILVAAWAKIQSTIADSRSKEAKKESSDAKADSSAAKAIGEVNSQRIGNVSQKVDLNNAATTTQLTALSLAVPPPPPATPTPESIAKAQSENPNP